MYIISENCCNRYFLLWFGINAKETGAQYVIDSHYRPPVSLFKLLNK